MNIINHFIQIISTDYYDLIPHPNKFKEKETMQKKEQQKSNSK